MDNQALTKNQNTFSGRAYIEKFCLYLKNEGHRPATEANHLGNLVYYRKFLESHGEQIETATVDTIRRYQSWLLDYKTRRGEPLAHSTHIRLLSTLKVFYRTLEKHGHVLNDPAKNITLPKEQTKLPTSILTPPEAKRLLKQPDLNTFSGFRDRAILEVLYACGLRIGELIGLEIGHIDVESKVLKVIDGKGGKDRNVPIGKTALDYVHEYTAQVRPRLLKGKTEVLFLNRFGQPFGVSGLLKKLKMYALAAGIEKNVTVHTFRHTLATQMLRRGATISHVQRILGHEKVTTTQLYTHVLKGDLQRVQKKHHPRESAALPAGTIQYQGFEK